ncbi:MAG: phage tail protein I [Sphingomonas paucimobilis]
MPAPSDSLLPPNATPFERAVERALSRMADIDTPIATLMDPATIDATVLPFLAWHLSVDRWEADWSEATKRATVASAIADQRRKGTPASVKAVLASFDDLLDLVEWHRTTPRGRPHTFEMHLHLGAAGGTRASAAFAEAIVRDVARVKPARSHGTLVQRAASLGIAELVGAGSTAGFARIDAAGVHDTDAIWGRRLQTEQGEPFETQTGQLLEH